MMTAPLQLEFVTSRRRGSPVGAVALALGVLAAVWAIVDYRDLATRDDLAQIQLEASAPRKSKSSRPPAAADKRSLDDAAAAVLELSLPWSQLLDELESAGQDTSEDVALLSLEPDREKRRVRIGAEARTLPAALEFVERLQKADTLAFPLLDSHKVRADQRERPVYFELTAQWKIAR